MKPKVRYTYTSSKPLEKNKMYYDTEFYQMYWNGENYYFNDNALDLVEDGHLLYVKDTLLDDYLKNDPESIIIKRIEHNEV